MRGAVPSNADDAPGAAAIGFLLMLAAVLFGVMTAQNRLPIRDRRTAHWRAAFSLPRWWHFSPCGHRSSAVLRATAGRAVGQRVGALATMGGSGRSRAADDERGHRGAEPGRGFGGVGAGGTIRWRE